MRPQPAAVSAAAVGDLKEKILVQSEAEYETMAATLPTYTRELFDGLRRRLKRQQPPAQQHEHQPAPSQRAELRQVPST